MSTLELGQRWCVLCSRTFFGGLLAGNCLPPTTLFLPPHIHNRTHISPFCLPVFLGLSVFLSSTFPPPYPNPSALGLCVSTCTSSLLSHLTPFEVWDSSKSNAVLFWTAKGKWLRKRGSSSITVVNQKSTLPSMAWCEKWFWFSSVKPIVCYMHRAIWRYLVHHCTYKNENYTRITQNINTFEDMQGRTQEKGKKRKYTCKNLQSSSCGSVQLILHTCKKQFSRSESMCCLFYWNEGLSVCACLRPVHFTLEVIIIFWVFIFWLKSIFFMFSDRCTLWAF